MNELSRKRVDEIIRVNRFMQYSVMHCKLNYILNEIKLFITEWNLEFVFLFDSNTIKVKFILEYTHWQRHRHMHRHTSSKIITLENEEQLLLIIVDSIFFIEISTRKTWKSKWNVNVFFFFFGFRIKWNEIKL